jgi:hypothetical protein
MFQHELREHKLVTLKETVQKCAQIKVPTVLFHYLIEYLIPKIPFWKFKKSPKVNRENGNLFPPKGSMTK